MDDVVREAKKCCKLQERIHKEYLCYLPDKLKDSVKYPKIVHALCTVQSQNAPYVARFIHQQIGRVFREAPEEASRKGDYTVLVIGPNRYLKQIYHYLKTSGDYTLHYPTLEPKSRTLQPLDAYRMMFEDRFSNLAWRILVECEQWPDTKTEDTVSRTLHDDKERIYEHCPRDFIERHEANLERLVRLRETGDISSGEQEALASSLKVTPEVLRIEIGMDETSQASDRSEQSPTGPVSVALTTYVGGKGLSADFVFILGLNEGILPRSNNNPSDTEICQFIVALGRTIKKCYLVSTSRFAGVSQGPRSMFVDWIEKERIENVPVNQDYWRSI